MNLIITAEEGYDVMASSGICLATSEMPLLSIIVRTCINDQMVTNMLPIDTSV